MRTRIRQRSAYLVAFVVVLVPVVWAQTGKPRQTPIVGLRHVAVEGSDTHVVITLTGDAALVGRLEELGTPPIRLFIDLKGVAPHVAGVTPVGQAGVERVRVALNQLLPPVTRVVLDLSHRSPFRIEEDAEARALRIIVGTPPENDRSLVADAPPGEIIRYGSWFTEYVAEVDRLLADAADTPLDGGVETARSSGWASMKQKLESATPPPALQEAHDLLRTAVALGVLAAPHLGDDGQQNANLEPARAGARLFVRKARAIVERSLGGPVNDDDQP